MKMLCFKFHQNCTINEEFDFFEGGDFEKKKCKRQHHPKMNHVGKLIQIGQWETIQK